MRKTPLMVMVLWLAIWCGSSLLLDTRVYAEKIPALSEVPSDMPLDVRVRFGQRRQALEKELADFQAAAAVFNAKEAKDQSDAEYQTLDAWRTRYIHKAKAFNGEVADARTGSEKPGKVSPYTVQFGSVRGEFCLESSDGSRLTHENMQVGRVARVDTGTRVTTGPTGRVQMVLPDDTVFTIGPSSDMVIDEFVYDPEHTEKISVMITIGVLRWVTGKVARKDPATMKVKTLHVAGGLRGTDFETFAQSDGSGYIKLFSGELEITPRNGSPPFVMKEKNMVRFKADGTVGGPEPIR